MQLRTKERLESIPKRNWVVYSFVALFLALTILSWPSEQFDIFSPPIDAILPIGAARIVTYPNGTQTSTLVASGGISLSGKGGLSADNPLKMKVTLFINTTALGFEPSLVTFVPLGASPYPHPPEKQSLPVAVAIALTKSVDNKWTGEGSIIYYQPGTMKWEIHMDGIVAVGPEQIEIDSAAVTVAARTNSLLVSLTWVILLFAVLEFRIEDQRTKC